MPPPDLMEELWASAPARRISVDQFHRMIDVGIIDEDEHVELIEGGLVVMTPQSAPHARILRCLQRLFFGALGGEFDILVQMPLSLGEWSEPDPDLAVVTREEADRPGGHPTHALLVVEVSRSTLRKDRGVKAQLYARHGIPEYWIINDEDLCIEVHRDPDPATGRYLTLSTSRPGDSLRPSSLPAPEVDVGALLG